MLVVSFSAVTAMDERAVSVTVSNVSATIGVSLGILIASPSVAVIVVVPVTDPAVTMPVVSTVATSVFDDAQVIYDDTFCVGVTPLDNGDNVAVAVN
jgi:hypothetical protein